MSPNVRCIFICSFADVVLMQRLAADGKQNVGSCAEDCEMISVKMSRLTVNGKWLGNL